MSSIKTLKRKPATSTPIDVNYNNRSDQDSRGACHFTYTYARHSSRKIAKNLNIRYCFQVTRRRSARVAEKCTYREAARGFAQVVGARTTIITHFQQIRPQRTLAEHTPKTAMEHPNEQPGIIIRTVICDFMLYSRAKLSNINIKII